MTKAITILEFLIFTILFVGLTPLLGRYMATVLRGETSLLHPILGWLERLTYRFGGIDPNQEMTWGSYAKALIVFNLLGFLALYLILLCQHLLPLNPQDFPGVPWPLAFNTAVSFVTNTNWQAYAGESTLSYFSQMLGLTVQNFLSAATGNAVLLAFIRGLTRESTSTIGNFWADLVRTITYILLPLSIIFAVVLVSQGVIQNFSSYVEATTLEGEKQMIPMGPAASQIAIKQLGTNGGGFFNANSAHPYENPSSFSNFLEALAILLIPSALTYTYGTLVGKQRQGWLLFLVMLFIWTAGIVVTSFAEHRVNPVTEAYPLLEGKEIRFGVSDSVLWVISTTATANGSVNAMLSSLSPLTGAVALFNILLGEVVFGGIGVGLCGMLMFVLLTVFLAGLMVGRTPEYLGKKVETSEIRWVSVAVLLPGALMLVGAGISSVLPNALSSVSMTGPHGLSELLYTFASTSGNNGSAFAGLNANTNYFNLILSVVMLLARLAIIVPSLAIAGLLARKTSAAPSIGTFRTDTFLFFVLLTAIILIVGALTYFPALSLGPIIEHFLMQEGRVFT